MTDFIRTDTGETVTGRTLYNYIRTGLWVGEERDDGTWEIVALNGLRFVLGPT